MASPPPVVQVVWVCNVTTGGPLLLLLELYMVMTLAYLVHLSGLCIGITCGVPWPAVVQVISLSVMKTGGLPLLHLGLYMAGLSEGLLCRQPR